MITLTFELTLKDITIQDLFFVIWLHVMKILKSSFDSVNISGNLRQTFLLAFGGNKENPGGRQLLPSLSYWESFIEEHNGFNSSYGIWAGIWCNSRVKIVPFKNILCAHWKWMSRIVRVFPCMFSSIDLYWHCCYSGLFVWSGLSLVAISVKNAIYFGNQKVIL